jgi:predicted nuclease with TOPRIM domain
LSIYSYFFFLGLENLKKENDELTKENCNKDKEFEELTQHFSQLRVNKVPLKEIKQVFIE